LSVTNSPKGRDEPKQIDSYSSTQRSIPGSDSAGRTDWLRSDEAENVRGTAPVSVVIPCYKCAATIERAVSSVALQSWRPAELILVDDGNTEDTLNALRMQERRLGSAFVHIISLPQNQGAAAARNAGWDAATQPYVAFLDADDAWHPRKLELQLRFMLEHPDVQICGHRVHCAENGIPMQDLSDDVRAKDLTKWNLLLGNPVSTPSVILRRALSLRFDPRKRHSEDYGLWLEAVSSGIRIALLDLRLAYIYKAPFGALGLSGALWKMEQGELGNYFALRKSGRITRATWLIVSVYSLGRHARRCLIVWLRRLHHRGES
jgi:glycosyltransferase involved in cell wall biosynthesis